MKKSEYLNEVLETHKMSKIQTLVDKYKRKRIEIEGAIEEHYGSDIYNVFISGSFAKHTATNIKFDMDVVVPFKKNSFSTLQEMIDDVHDFLYEKYDKRNLAKVIKQKVSVGITFNKDEDGDQIQIDVVPGREVNLYEYRETNDLNLYFNEDHWGFKKGTWTKTNIRAQIENIEGKKSERDIIRLLKIWKKRLNKDYKSFMIELFVIKAFEKYTGCNDLWSRLKHAMQYIADNVTNENFSLIDPGNSNNNVLSSLDAYKKQSLSSEMQNIISNVEHDENWLRTYFPTNEKYKKTEKEKGFGLDVVSYPPTAKRFG
ncbi:MAG: nucleotidyltransferase [Paludibacteraceae bacterium]|nr:nucleotidyltransferase [Paludibacteraceae bacterium]